MRSFDRMFSFAIKFNYGIDIFHELLKYFIFGFDEANSRI